MSLPVPIPPISRPLNVVDAAYVGAVRDLLIDAPGTIRPWWSEQCPTCYAFCPDRSGETEPPEIEEFHRRHFVISRHVVIACDGRHVVNLADASAALNLAERGGAEAESGAGGDAAERKAREEVSGARRYGVVL